jgi:hypothetical protein
VLADESLWCPQATRSRIPAHVDEVPGAPRPRWKMRHRTATKLLSCASRLASRRQLPNSRGSTTPRRIGCGAGANPPSGVRLVEIAGRDDTKILWDLTGVDVLAGLQRAAALRPGPTDWELLQFKEHPDWLARTTWYENGLVVRCPEQLR